MEKKTKILIKRVSIFTVTLALAGGGAFMLTPNRTRTVTISGNNNNTIPVEDNDDSYFSRFVAHMTNSMDEESEESIPAIKASLEDVYVSWGEGKLNKSEPLNRIAINGDFFLTMNSISDTQFTADFNLTYNNEDIDFAVGYVDHSFYLALDDLKIKSSGMDHQNLIETLHTMFFDSENVEGLGMTVDVDRIVDNLLGGFDINSLLDSFSDDSGAKVNFSINEGEKQENGLVNEYISVFKQDVNGQKIEDLVNVSLVLDASDDEHISLDSVNINSLSFNGINAGGKIRIFGGDEVKVLGLDDENYQGRVKRDGFKQAFSYIGFADKILDFLMTRKAGLTANLTLNDLNTGVLYAGLEANVNFDLSTILPNWSGLVLHEAIAQKMNRSKDLNEPEEEESFTDKLLNNIVFGVDVSLTGQQAGEYANLGVHYKNQTGYLTLNEGVDEFLEDNTVMRASIDTATVQKIIEKVPAMMEAVVGEENEEKASSLFSAITDSELVTAIKDGDYSGILNVLHSVTNDDDTISLELNLSTLGLGNNSRVTIVLDSRSENKILNVTASNIELETVELNLTLKTNNFSSEKIDRVISNADKYDSLNYLPSIFDQVTGILQSKKAGFALTGSVLDAQGLGLRLNGWGQFDYGTKYGFGALDIDQYKTLKNNVPQLYTSHNIKLDVDNQGSEFKNRNVKFTYGAHEGIKGNMTVQTFVDLFDLFMTFIDENKDDERFSKFIDPIVELLGFSYIADIIDKQDYAKLASNNIIKSIKESANHDSVSIVIAGHIMSLDNDLVININFKGTGENRQLKSLSVPGLGYNGKTIVLELEVKDFDDNKTSPVNKNATFMDFSDIKVLLDFGLNTTKQGYYHLTAKVNLKLIGIDMIKFDLDFYVQVIGNRTKVYGLVPKLPSGVLLMAFVNSYNATSYTEFVFEPNRSASGNDIGGYFHILKTEQFSGGLFSSAHTDKTYWKSSSKNFVDADNNATNLLYYILYDMLNIRETYVNTIVEKINEGTESDEAGKPADIENIFEDGGFEYTHNANSNQHDWYLGINLKSLTNSSALGVLNVDLTGVSDGDSGYLSKAHIDTAILKIVIQLKADITLVNPGASASGWESDGIEAKYVRIAGDETHQGVYDKIVASGKKTTFDNTYYNNAKKGYNVSSLL